MKNQRRDQQLTGMAGEFLTVGKLFKRGYQASVTFGNAKAVDVLVYNPRNDKSFNVQVKTLRHRNCFLMKKEYLSPDHIYVFILLHDFEQPEEYFILPGREILQDIDKFFGTSYRDPNKPSNMPAINYGPLVPYRDNWQVFDTYKQRTNASTGRHATAGDECRLPIKMRGIMKNNGFSKIGDWYINNDGGLDISYPSSISNISGIIAILVNNELLFFSSTSHYGPRIRDFKHAINGNTQSARIHSNIIEALEDNKTVSLWVKNSTSPSIEKSRLIRKHNPPWNRQKLGITI